MRLFLVLLLTITAVAVCDEPAADPLWASGFEKIEVGEAPEDGLVLEGEFAVAQESDKNKALRLPGAPLGTFGMLVGPSRRADVSVTARVLSERKGRRYPAFGVGLCGNSGYRLQVTAGRDELELLLNGETVERVPYEWKSGAWTRVRLEVVATGEADWIVRGRAWIDGDEEPKTWMIETETEKKPRNGGASVWGLPYSGEAIWFDDLVYDAVVSE